LARELVEQALAAGGLDPASCGWHYVEGLRDDDDPELAVAWDKVEGLDHNGQRRPGLAHEVVFVDGSVRLVTVRDWPNFAAEQRERLARTKATRSAGAPRIRWSDEATLGPNPEKGRADLQERSDAEHEANLAALVPR
jgi:hypothetical protein